MTPTQTEMATTTELVLNVINFNLFQAVPHELQWKKFIFSKENTSSQRLVQDLIYKLPEGSTEGE